MSRPLSFVAIAVKSGLGVPGVHVVVMPASVVKAISRADGGTDVVHMGPAHMAEAFCYVTAESWISLASRMNDGVVSPPRDLLP